MQLDAPYFRHFCMRGDHVAAGLSDPDRRCCAVDCGSRWQKTDCDTERTCVLRYIAHLAIAAPRRIIAVAVLVMVGAAVFGIPGIKSLSAAGFQDPTAE